jgi:Ca2+-binding EF-hand superfamily protein
VEGMKILFCEGFEKSSKFIFDLYDFDKDGYITKEDIRVVLSYVPLKTQQKEDSLKFEKY